MRKIKATLGTLFVTSSLLAMPVGNPADATLYRQGVCSFSPCGYGDFWSVRVGFYGDYVFNRHMEVDNSDNANIDTTQIFTSGGIVTFNLCQWLDLYAVLAGSFARIETPGSAFGASNILTRLDTSSGFSWGLGGRISSCLYRGLLFGVEGGYFSAPLDLTSGTREASVPVYLEGVDFHYREWQVALGLTQTFCGSDNAFCLLPYIALKFAGAHIDMGNVTVPGLSSTLFDLKNRQTTGFAVGITSLFYQMSGITVEGIFGDELALTLNTCLRF